MIPYAVEPIQTHGPWPVLWGPRPMSTVNGIDSDKHLSIANLSLQGTKLGDACTNERSAIQRSSYRAFAPDSDYL